jgi:hypothetical protein
VRESRPTFDIYHHELVGAIGLQFPGRPSPLDVVLLEVDSAVTGGLAVFYVGKNSILRT